ncbi:MAG: LptA/OstA family protein [Bacillota bacterium]
MNKYKKLLVLLVLTVLITVSWNYSSLAAVRMQADHLQYQDNQIIIEGNVLIRQEDMEIEARKGDLNREQNKIVLEQGINMLFAEGEIRSARMTGWLDSSRYVFEESVDFVYQGQSGSEDEQGQSKKEGEQDRSGDSGEDTAAGRGFRLKAPYLEIKREQQSFLARDGVSIDYRDKQLSGQRAEFDEEGEELTLLEEVVIEESNGDWVKGEKAVIDLGEDREEIIVEKDVEIKVELNQQ